MSNTFKHKNKGKYNNGTLEKLPADLENMFDRSNNEWGKFRKVKKYLTDKIAEKELKTEIKCFIEEGTDFDIPKQDEILEEVFGNMYRIDKIMEKYRTIHENDVIVNPSKELCKDRDCKKSCKCREKVTYLENLINQVPDNAYNIKLPVIGIIESAKKELKTENKFVEQRNYLANKLYKIQELVNTQSNDMLLGEAVRKLFL
jgi:hypothetical protein